jgi:hypothetical protein
VLGHLGGYLVGCEVGGELFGEFCGDSKGEKRDQLVFGEVEVKWWLLGNGKI